MVVVVQESAAERVEIVMCLLRFLFSFHLRRAGKRGSRVERREPENELDPSYRNAAQRTGPGSPFYSSPLPTPRRLALVITPQAFIEKNAERLSK
jgi:hypothetical protein